MTARPKKYRRCKACKELIAAHHEDCPNCAERNKLTGFVPVRDGQRGRPTLDIQEGNLE